MYEYGIKYDPMVHGMYRQHCNYKSQKKEEEKDHERAYK
jgi:hypothetical protein